MTNLDELAAGPSADDMIARLDLAGDMPHSYESALDRLGRAQATAVNLRLRLDRAEDRLTSTRFGATIAVGVALMAGIAAGRLLGA